MEEIKFDSDYEETRSYKIKKVDQKLKVLLPQEDSDTESTSVMEWRIWFRSSKDFDYKRKRPEYDESGLDFIKSYVKSYFKDVKLDKKFAKGFKGNGLIEPCNWKGTMKYVHKTCLEKWLASQADAMEDF